MSFGSNATPLLPISIFSDPTHQSIRHRLPFSVLSSFVSRTCLFVRNNEIWIPCELCPVAAFRKRTTLFDVGFSNPACLLARFILISIPWNCVNIRRTSLQHVPSSIFFFLGLLKESLQLSPGTLDPFFFPANWRASLCVYCGHVKFLYFYMNMSDGLSLLLFYRYWILKRVGLSAERTTSLQIDHRYFCAMLTFVCLRSIPGRYVEIVNLVLWNCKTKFC